MYKYIRYIDSVYSGDNFAEMIRWTDSDTSTLKYYRIKRAGKSDTARLIVKDMKDEYLILYDDSHEIFVVQSPNIIKYSIRLDVYMGVEFVYINDFDESNKTLIIGTNSMNGRTLIQIHDLYSGELLRTIPYPEEFDTLSTSDYTMTGATRWGHYICGDVYVSSNVDSSLSQVWVYNMVTNQIEFKLANSSSFTLGLVNCDTLSFPNLIPPTYDITQPTGYSLYAARGSYVSDFVMASIDIERMEYTNWDYAHAGEWHDHKACTFFGYSTSAGSNYYVFRNTRAKHNWQLRRFNGTTYIDKTIFYQDEIDPVPISVIKLVRTKGGHGDFLYMYVNYGNTKYIQQLTDDFSPVGDTINITDMNISNFGGVADIFLSNYMFEGDVEKPTVSYRLLGGYNNIFKFDTTRSDTLDTVDFKIGKITWDGNELQFTHNGNELILQGHESWEINGNYICEIEEQWTNLLYSELSFIRNQTISTIIDNDNDGKNDYDFGIEVPKEYYDYTHLRPYIELRRRDSYQYNTLYNRYFIRIANPIVGGTPWYNFTGKTLGANVRVKYNATGEIVHTSGTIQNVTNDGWAISGSILVSINKSYLDSSNRATIILEIETPTGEWITSKPFQINNYSNDYNYRWRFSSEDEKYIYFTLNGDYTAANNWYKPYTLDVFDGEERVGEISRSYSTDDGVATMKLDKAAPQLSRIPKHGFWFHFEGSGYDGGSLPKGFSGVDICSFTPLLNIQTSFISQNIYEVTQLNNTPYILEVYFTENVEVYKDGIKLEGSYDKDNNEIKFILPEDTPKEMRGHTLNLQYKVFYNDEGEIKHFLQDFTYTTYASYFVELDPDFKNYYWEKIYSYPPTDDNYTLSNGTFVYHNGHLYLTGSYFFDGGYQKKLYRYTIENDKWIELTGPSYDTFKTHPVVYDNKIYYIGGATYSNYEYLSKVQIYDIESDTWSYGTDCPRNQGPREFQPILYNNKIYCFSGYCNDYPSPKSLMHIYNIESDSWETIDTPYSLRNYSATCIDGKIYICDGADSSANYITTLYVYDIEANEWTTGPDKPVYPNGGQADGGTMLNKFVSILGYLGESIKTMSFVYDIQKDKWMRLPDAPKVLEYTYDFPLCVTDDSEVYVMKYNYFYRLTKPKVTYSDAYLYEYEGKYYTENDNGELIETTTQELTDDLFAIEGVYSINSDLIKPNMKVLYYKVENKDVVPQVKYSGVYEGATITMDWDLQSEQGKTFNVLGDVYSDDNVRFLLSNDKGQTWLTFDGYEVVSCDINNIKDNGMTYDVFTSLIPSQLQSFKGGTNSLRIAIYIEQYSVNGKTNIDHIRLRY